MYIKLDDSLLNESVLNSEGGEVGASECSNMGLNRPRSDKDWRDELIRNAYGLGRWVGVAFISASVYLVFLTMGWRAYDIGYMRKNLPI